MSFVELTLPVCPGVNALYRSFVRPGSRYAVSIKSERYRNWITQAGHELQLQKPGSIPGLFKISLLVPRKRGDLDGFLKATLDLLQTHGVIANDKYCEEINVRWTSSKSMLVVITSLEGANQ